MTRQCWAYNLNGDRCQKPPGHKGSHQIKFLWDDSDCYSPQGRPLIEVFAEEETEQAPAKCVACKHAHQGGQCKCGCYEYVG